MLAAELNHSRRIGTEFEMTVPLVGTGGGGDIQTTIARVLSANGVRAIARPYDHSLLPANVDVAVEHDASVRGEARYDAIQWYPVEIKTKILDGIADWERVVPKTLEVAKYLGARVNVSCGHHVHVSLAEARTDFSVIRSLYALTHRIEPVIYGLVAPSRQSCGYARPLPITQADLVRDCESRADYEQKLANWDRYRGLNLSHVLSGAPRVEYRYHGGTLEVDKARNWLRLLLRITDHAVARTCHSTNEQISNDRRGIERLLICLGLKVNSRICPKVSPELRETGKFLLARWKHLNAQVLAQIPTAPSAGSEAA